ncbi:hypothetical protein DRE_00341 [Drechslerella stenobrocha 248]|uniref:Uncharacterized protein n=1 Tax=Drechslerella stenobrocha 248 TaxID=1043628 RepID=W7I5B4_9PEZI|nr:hypothetical protein DRE_00341 [Drechslerella stenobrocha 248]
MADTTNSPAGHLHRPSPFPPSPSPTPPVLVPSSSSPLPIKSIIDFRHSLVSSPHAYPPFPASPASILSSESPLRTRARQHTVDSAFWADMDGASTAATSLPPPKLDENIHPNPPSLPVTQVPVSGTTVQPLSPPAAVASKPQGNARAPVSLNKPKAEHMQFFLNSLPPARNDSPNTRLEDKPSDENVARSASPDPVPAVVQALEDVQKHTSKNSNRGSIRSRPENHRSAEVEAWDNITSCPAGPSSGRFPLAAESLPTEFEQLNDASSLAAVVGSNAGESGIDGGDSTKRSAISFGFLKRRTNSTQRSGKMASGEGQSRGPGLLVRTTESSPPISMLSNSARYRPGRPAPRMVDGTDARNFATWRRDLMIDYENRKLEGRHEHPFEGSTALRHRSNIKSIGLKQLMRSISNTIKKSSNSFKKLVLRRARTIPNQFSAAVHGHIPHAPPPAPTRKFITRAQRVREYESIVGTMLPTFGPRVPTPPPIVKQPSLEILRPDASGANQSTSATAAGKRPQVHASNGTAAPRRCAMTMADYIPPKSLFLGFVENDKSNAKNKMPLSYVGSEKRVGTSNKNSSEGAPPGFVESAFRSW